MKQARTMLFLSALLMLTACASSPPAPLERIEPDTSLAEKVERWPSEQELLILRSLRGKTDQDVLRALGHPFDITVQANGLTRWIYPWKGAGAVFLKDGIVVGSVYTTDGK